MLDDHTPPHGFKPAQFHKKGTIYRVKLHNFMTYSDVELFPGCEAPPASLLTLPARRPQMNFVIGPNGTGKSSVVCALCIGLGGHPKVFSHSSACRPLTDSALAAPGPWVDL